MSVSSVGEASSAAYTQALQAKSEAKEAKAAGPDHDGDKDDGASQVKTAAPTTNTSGQTIGQVINTTA